MNDAESSPCVRAAAESGSITRWVSGAARAGLMFVAFSFVVWQAPQGLGQQPPQPPIPQQQARPAPSAQTPALPPPLAGPAVEMDQAPGAEMGFGDSQAMGPYVVRLNLRLYNMFLKNIRLTAEQQSAIDSINHQYFVAQQTYRQVHAPEMRRLREVIARNVLPPDADGPAPPGLNPPPSTPQTAPVPGERPGEQRPPSHPQAPRFNPAGLDQRISQLPPAQQQTARAALDRLRTIEADGPVQEPFMQRIWDVLNPDQQAQFRSDLDQYLQQRRVQALERRLEQQHLQEPQKKSSHTDASEGQRQTKQSDASAARANDGRNDKSSPEQLTPEQSRRRQQILERRAQQLRQAQPQPFTPDDIQFDQVENGADNSSH